MMEAEGRKGEKFEWKAGVIQKCFIAVDKVHFHCSRLRLFLPTLHRYCIKPYLIRDRCLGTYSIVYRCLSLCVCVYVFGLKDKEKEIKSTNLYRFVKVSSLRVYHRKVIPKVRRYGQALTPWALLLSSKRNARSLIDWRV